MKLKVRPHGAAAAAFFFVVVFFFAATIGLHCNKLSHSHCVTVAAAAAVLLHRMGSASCKNKGCRSHTV